MHPLARSRRRLPSAEWPVLALALLALVVWLSPPQRLERLNHLVQDAGLRLHQRSPQPDIALIAIDDASLAAIGRWPWRRALHAQLVNTVTQQQPRAIALDVLFNEPDLDYPADDVLLARALAASGRTVLPVVQRSHGPPDQAGQTDLPLPLLAQAAVALGHVHVALGTDGVVRDLFLQEGPHSAPWPHLSVALQCAAGAARPECRTAATDSAAHAVPEPWVQQQRERIAYAGAAAQWPTYSYIDVLRGQVPPDAFTGKYVLVGAVAVGLGDIFATPVNPSARLMPGVHIVAHALDAQLANIHWRAAPGWLNAAFNALPIAAALLGLLLLRPLAGLALIAALLLGTAGLTLAAPWLWGLQLAPAAALVVLPLVYPLWSWRRLHAATHYLQREMQRLQQENLPLLAPLPVRGDFLQRRMDAVKQATQQLRELHRFVSESLEQLPSPILVCSPAGEVVLANAAARAYADSTGAATLQGCHAADLLQHLRSTTDQQPLLTAQTLAQGSVPAHSEGQDAQGRSLLLQCQPFARTDHMDDSANDVAGHAGWLLTLVDLSDIRRALALRDQALNFISHDIRAPNASILTLLDMQRAHPEQLATPELLARIERYAQTSLGMAESFVQLASAQSQPLAHELLDLVSVLEETIDDAWVLARQQRVTVRTSNAPEVALCHGDRTLLRRALANVLHNALKYSPPGTQVQCSIHARTEGETAHWVVSVRDQGLGIPADQLERLCTPFARLHARSHPGIGGIGLGLALVQTVLQRHGGTLEIDSSPGEGAQFSLVLMQADAHS